MTAIMVHPNVRGNLLFVENPFNPEHIASYLSSWQSTGMLPLVVVAAYIIGSMLFVPIFALVFATAYVLSPVEGALCSFLGVVAGGMVGYTAGRVFGERLFPARARRVLEAVRGKISEHEITSVAIIRKLPIAPFTIVNMAIGALKVRATSFALGTAVGMAPVIVLLAVLSKSYHSASHEHSWKFTAYSVAGTVLVLIATLSFERLLKRRSDAR
ncbi:MAG: VTT domain-containing protein [Bdellovibrionota bacterium]